MRLPSSPFNSVEPNPGRKIPAQRMSTIRSAWKRFTGRISKRQTQSARSNVWLLPLAGAWLGLALPAGAAADAPFQAKAEHVVLVIWDGMRPDFITAETAPTAHALAKSGTFFANHHAVYVTSTEVNGTALATGCYPNRSGIMANREYRPDVQLIHPVGTEDAAYIRLSDALTGGKYLAVPTVAETIQAAGFPTLITGTKPVAALQDRSLERKPGVGAQSLVLDAGMTLPREKLEEIESAIGKYPLPPEEIDVPNLVQNEWTTRALTEVLWKQGVPKYTVLWLSDPDYTQHQVGPGEENALAAIKGVDGNLAKVLAALEAKGVRDKTDIFLVSDHAFSTVNRTIELVGLLKRAGIAAVRVFHETPRPGEVLVVSLGGSVTLYVTGHDRGVCQRIVNFLQASDFSGPILMRGDPLPGTFALKDARIDTPEAPDIVFSYRWTSEKNRFGVPGSFVSEGIVGRKPGFGTHASLSRFDFHNTLLAAGPDIRAGFRDQFPSANVDVAPTILHLLGIPQQQPMDGRVLSEALAAEKFEPTPPETKLLQAKSEARGRTWEQYLKYTLFADRTYLDEGNVGAAPAP
jgi:arylsulfatase A-like enzyme